MRRLAGLDPRRNDAGPVCRRVIIGAKNTALQPTLGDRSSVYCSRAPFLLLVTALTLLMATALAGCTSGVRLPGNGTVEYRERALSSTDGGLRVTTSVLSANESIDV
jgi:hypothetical protein